MMADSDLSLLSFLKARYPLVPTTTVLKVMNKYENDQEKCRQALDSEIGKRFYTSDSESLTVSVSLNSNGNNNLDSPNEGKSIMARIKELQLSHEGNPQSKIPNSERHVSAIERSIGNTSRPFVNQSMSWTMQASGRQSPATVQTATSQMSASNVTTPQTAPLDFSSFFNHTATNIPNINCRTHVTSGSGLAGSMLHGSRPQQIPFNVLPSLNSPVEQRHPVKVINIPTGSSLGGSASSSANPGHIHMNFKDTDGLGNISTLSTMQRYGSTPNVSQNYKSEIRTETLTPQPVHSSSIVVNTSSHTNHPAPERQLNTSNDTVSGCGRRTPNHPLSLNTDDLLSNCGPRIVYSSGKLSTPVQATSPGIAHSKPVFVEITTDRLSGAEMHGGYNGTNYTSGFNPVGSVRPPPLNSNYLSHQSMTFNAQTNPMLYNSQFSQDFPNTFSFPVIQSQNDYLYYNSQQQKPPNFHSPPSNLSQHPISRDYRSHFYPQFDIPTTLMGCQFVPGHFPRQVPGLLSHAHYNPNTGHSSGTQLSKSFSTVRQQSLSSKSSSQDSEHSMGKDYDVRYHTYNTRGSHDSSLDDLNLQSSSHAEEEDSSTQPYLESTHDETEYARALIQHQERQLQKLLGEMNSHGMILNKLRSEVAIMEKNMIETCHINRSFPSSEDIWGLCESNRSLQTDIQLYMNEIDMYKSGQTPFNKINLLDQNFFENMPTGQQDPICTKTPDDIRSLSPRLIPPPRPPPPIPVRQRSTDIGQASGGAVSGSDIFRVPPVQPAQPVMNSGDSEEGESWNCSACTFSNHPALKKCEMCEMPRVMPPHPVSSLGPPPPVTSQHILSSLPPRLAPVPALVGNMLPRPDSPHSALGHNLHHAGK